MLHSNNLYMRGKGDFYGGTEVRKLLTPNLLWDIIFLGCEV